MADLAPPAAPRPALRSLRPQTEAPLAEEEILAFWREHRTFERSVSERPADRRFVFFEGPPTANGAPGVHHAISRLMKDLFCRYHTMLGYRVTRKAGWDTHGLPVEIEVEKELGLNGKEQIESYGIGRFNQACRASVFRYEQEWRHFTERLGYWLDLDDRYATCENSYIESVWSLLQNFWERGLIYRGHKVVPYCPRCGTPLSSHETSLGFREVEDPSVYVRLPLLDAEGREEKGAAGGPRSLLVWTTTPWTLISNVAVAVHPEETYALVRRGDEELILVEARREAVLGEPHEVVRRFPGRELVGRRYRPLFAFTGPSFDALAAAPHRVVAADFVTVEDGTGLVHIAPAFGEDDYRLGEAEGLPVVRPVDGRGRFTAEVTPWAGVAVKKADPGIVRDLKERGLLYREERVTHSYPFCWRCDSYLIYYARESWFLRTTQFREALQRENARIRWVPEEMGSGRFGRWLEGNVDWALSRDRYWGTPLNIWSCAGCGKQTSVGSIAELGRLAGGALPEPVDLHRPYVDDLALACPECGGRLQRTPEVLDCWFDSGAMPYAQWGFPVNGREEFAQHFPADFIAEAVDQTRGWFYSLLAISTLYSGETSYRSCLVSELVLDERGRKMSKSLGNAVPPDTVFSGAGADALRWYLAVVNPPWTTTRFSLKGVEEQAQKLLATLRNVCAFFVTYAGIDGPDGRGWDAPPPARQTLDRWILSRLEATVEEVGRELDAYQMTRAARRLQDFVVEELSNWYVRRSRRRFWRHGIGEDKAEAYHTLFWVVERLSRLIAPYVPFLAEEIWQKVVRPLAAGRAAPVPESVHLADFPRPVDALRAPALEGDMQTLLALVGLGRAARMEAGIKVRQPLARLGVWVAGADAAALERLGTLSPLAQDELNVRELAFASGAPAGAPPEGVVSAAEGAVSVALETRLTPELRAEGLARELVNKIQFMRKRGGFRVTDRIVVGVAGSAAIQEAIGVHEAFIRQETLADSIRGETTGAELVKEWDINGEPATIALTRRA